MSLYVPLYLAMRMPEAIGLVKVSRKELHALLVVALFVGFVGGVLVGWWVT